MFVANCPACSERVCGGSVCECGYLSIDEGGRAYSRRNEKSSWENAPNILIWVEEQPEEAEVMDEPPAPQWKSKKEED